MSDRGTRRHRVVFLTEDEANVLSGKRAGPGPNGVLIHIVGLTTVERCCGHLSIFHRRGTMCSYCAICGHIDYGEPRPTYEPKPRSWLARLFDV